jgi:hypothetical protein
MGYVVSEIKKGLHFSELNNQIICQSYSTITATTVFIKEKQFYNFMTFTLQASLAKITHTQYKTI